MFGCCLLWVLPGHACWSLLQVRLDMDVIQALLLDVDANSIK
jgi:hypothetical protein